MDDITLSFDELIVPDFFDQYRRVEGTISSCLNCVNCINCGQPANHNEPVEADENEEQSIPQSYKCQEQNCSKTFIDENQLLSHGRKHDSVFECQFDNCEQRFKIKSNLKRHHKTHTKEKPFLCNECHKSFTTTTNLKQHLQIHQGDNKRSIFECEVDNCTKKYYYLCNLKKHKKQHTQDFILELGSPEFTITVGKCLLSLSTTLCSCQKLVKISITKEDCSNNQTQIEEMLQKAFDDGSLQVCVVLDDFDLQNLREFEQVLKWVCQSQMTTIHMTGMKQQSFVELTQYVLDKLKKTSKV